MLASEGVVQADTYLQIGETIRPVRRDGDRRGYVIAIADTSEEALRRAETASKRLHVEVDELSCSFDLTHYSEILEAAKTGGYRFTTFDESPEPGHLFLRHDIDLSLDAALRMAELEAEHEVRTTYLLMTESIFYNLASSEGVSAIARLRELGHAVGLHAVYPNVELDERFDPVVSWHNPSAEYMSARFRERRTSTPSRISTHRRIARTRISTGARAVRTKSCAAVAFRGSRSSSIRRSGRTRARRWGSPCDPC